MATLKYWLWLTTRKGFAPSGIMALLDHFGTPEAVYFADPEEYGMIPGITRQGIGSLSEKSLDDTKRILEDCDRLGCRILTITDASYPERLRNLYDPPLLLYVRGRDLSFDDEVAIGLIGTRDPTAYGVAQACRLGEELAEQGALVVSGLARGLDSEGLKGALRMGGSVAGVLGGGIDVIYPRENRYLYEDVASSGLLISEYPPGTETRPAHFPVRNRIISGLSLGVVVVEGGFNSGTRITARAALDQNRDVFAVPGPVDAPMSFTPNDLIRRGEAKLITGAQDILEEYRAIYPHKLRMELAPASSLPAIIPGPRPRGAKEEISQETEGEETLSVDGKKKTVDKERKIPYIHWKDLSPTPTDDQRDILLALGERDLTMDELVEASQVPAQRAGTAITMLQLAGYVTETAGKRFSAAFRIQGD